MRLEEMNLSQAVAELAKAKRQLEDAQRAEATAKPGTTEYLAAVRRVGTAWHKQRRAHLYVERLRKELPG